MASSSWCGRADLAHGQHVERGAEPFGHGRGDRDPAAGQAEHDGRFVGLPHGHLVGDVVGEDRAGLAPVAVPPRGRGEGAMHPCKHLPGGRASVRPRSGPVSFGAE